MIDFTVKIGVVMLSPELYDFDRDADEIAEEKGCYVVFPKQNQIQLDIDTKEQSEMFTKRLADFSNTTFLTFEVVSKIKSSSGKPHHWHITIDVFENDEPRKLSETERICLQFSLGSDPVRETMNVMRMFRGVKNPTRLFEKKPDKIW